MIHGDQPQDPLEQEAVLRRPVERRLRTTWDDAAPNVEKVNGLYPCSSCGAGLSWSLNHAVQAYVFRANCEGLHLEGR